MNTGALRLFREMVRTKGYITKKDSAFWELTSDFEVMNELEGMGYELGFKIISTSQRLYLVPDPESPILLKNNVDYKNDIKQDGETKNIDIYLISYLIMFILYLFFNGKGTELCVRNLLLKEDLIKEFDSHCKQVCHEAESEKKSDIDDDFVKLAEIWLAKIEGDPDKRRKDEKYGIVNKAIKKLTADELFTENESTMSIEPTQKLLDIMPYVLDKERVKIINDWFKEKDNAKDI